MDFDMHPVDREFKVFAQFFQAKIADIAEWAYIVAEDG